MTQFVKEIKVPKWCCIKRRCCPSPAVSCTLAQPTHSANTVGIRQLHHYSFTISIEIQRETNCSHALSIYADGFALLDHEWTSSKRCSGSCLARVREVAIQWPMRRLNTERWIRALRCGLSNGCCLGLTAGGVFWFHSVWDVTEVAPH